MNTANARGVGMLHERHIAGLDRVGVIQDQPPHQLPLEAFTVGKNVRFRDGKVQRLGGWSSIFGTPSGAPQFAMSVKAPSVTWWLYTSLTKAYAYDGTSHSDITRASGGDYNASSARNWNGTILGGIPILNSGADVPQYWGSFSGATNLAALSNWNSAHRCAVMRAFGPYLVAIYITKSGTVSQHMVKWSHPAVPGSLPSSWDETDTTKDAGEYELPDLESGRLLDCMTLRGRMMLYKESATWSMTHIKGIDIFDFTPFLETSGVLTERCAVPFGRNSQHFVPTQDDIVVHDGSQVESILTARNKKALFGSIDISNYRESFSFVHPEFDEVWFCYPESGHSEPSLALIWNYTNNTISFTDISFVFASTGTVETASSGTWSTASGTWEEQEGSWASSERRKTVLCDAENTKFHQLDSGLSRDGTSFDAVVSREALALLGRTQNNEWIADFSRRVQAHKLWISAEGGVFKVRVGTQETPKGSISWGNEIDFDPSTDRYVDVSRSGFAMAIEFSSQVDVHWAVSDYNFEYSKLGKF